MILAVVLSALVLLGWRFVSRDLLPDRQPADDEGREGQERAAAAAPGRSRRRYAAGDPRPRARAAETPRVPIETPRLAGSINLSGARIDDLVLTTERETIAAEFAADPAASPRPARPPPISPSSAGRAPASPCPTPTRVWRRAATG